MTHLIAAKIRYVELKNGGGYVIRYTSKNYGKLARILIGKIPPPIISEYNWPGVPSPYKPQVVTSTFMTLNPRCFVLNGMGSGKTLCSIWAYDFLKSKGEAKKAIVLSPLSTLDRVWGDEIFRRTTHLTFQIITGPAARRVKLFERDVDIYILNHDALRVKPLMEKIMKRDDIDTVIVDEGSEFSNQSTEKWKRLRDLCRKVPRVWWLTGTPRPQSPVDVWAQVRIVNPDNITPSKVRWRDMVMRQVSKFVWQEKENCAKIVHRAMQPAVRFPLEAFVDLPPHVFEHRQVPMSKEQEKAFTQMAQRLQMEIASSGGVISAANEAVKAGKLLQILGGAIYDENHSIHLLNAKARIDAVKEIISQSDRKTIVFATHVHVAKMLHHEIKGSHLIHGDIKKSDRDKVFHIFQHKKDRAPLIAQPNTMAHGLTLTAATTIVWYGPAPSNRIFEQAMARIRRATQDRTTVVVFLSSHPWELQRHKRLQNKEKLQGMLLELFSGKYKTRKEVMMKEAALIEKYLELRTMKEETEKRHKKELEPIRTAMSKIENALLLILNRTGLDSIKEKNVGTAFKKEVTSVTLSDRAAFLDYCIDNSSWDLLDIKANRTAINERVKEGKELPPGVNRKSSIVVQVRR